MPDIAEAILSRIRALEPEITGVCQDLVRIPSENPPDDTSKVGSYVEKLLAKWKCDVRRIEPAPGHVNLVATWDSGRPGKHLVLNGHLDTFPAGPAELWDRDPFSGDIERGRLHGRGVTDMKAGVTASLFTFRVLREFADELKGRVSLTLVCDEEAFGEYGARHVLANEPDLYGDALLNGEPGSRVADKGFVWSEVEFPTRGGHAAYANVHENAIDRAVAFLAEVRKIHDWPSPMPAKTGSYLDRIGADMERKLGKGATGTARQYVVCPGIFEAGTKVNMAASLARVQLDVRIPVGGKVAPALRAIRAAAKANGGRVTVINTTEPSITDPEGPFARLVGGAVRRVTGRSTNFGLGLGCTDARLWRYKRVPAICYGPVAHSMGGTNEYVELTELHETAAIHAVAAASFLRR
jgi:succinyl-diaminopimelate desuccinylase